jgi:pimeloyl-ACP methyl ester carboxylesterase
MSNDTPATDHALDVPGARLHYQVRGSGPVLLMIGAPMDSTGFAAIAPLLADDYTVVTYDPRGISGSTRDATDQDATPEALADDAHRLLTALGAATADVFGSSGGAIIGLALVTRHPDQVRTLIAHEPPLTELLPDSARQRTAIDTVYDTYQREGPDAAMQTFFAVTAIPGGPMAAGGPPQRAVGPRAGVSPDPNMSARMQGNLDTFLGYMLRPLTHYRPDIPALRAASTRITVGAGVTSAGQLAHRTAAALADQLDTTLVDFPGDHAGFAGEPAAFGRTLHDVLTATHQ